MPLASWLYRPRVLACVFGAYFAIVMFASWMFASKLQVPWFGAELSRWVYMSFIVASAVFLCGTGLLAFKIQDAFEGRVRTVNRQLGKYLWDKGIVMPPDGDAGLANGDVDLNIADAVGGDLDEMLEVLGEVQTEAVQEMLVDTSGEVVEETDAVEDARGAMLQRDLLRRRAGLRRHQDYLLHFLAGPVGLAVGILGISMVMLPATDVMLQTFHGLNTALILGFSYAWLGLAAYFGASVLGLAASLRTERKRRRKERRRRIRKDDE